MNNPVAAFSLLKPLFETAIPHIEKHGGLRLECKASEDSRNTHAWLHLLGFKMECKLRRYGRGGSTYLQFAYFLPADDGDLYGDKWPSDAFQRIGERDVSENQKAASAA